MISAYPALRFAGQYDQSKPAADEFAAFARHTVAGNSNNSRVPLTNIFTGAPLDTLVRTIVKDDKDAEKAGDEKAGEKEVIGKSDIMEWGKSDHLVWKREMPAYVTTLVNPLIALASGIAHSNFGRAGYTELDLEPLRKEFPRVVQAIATRSPKKIKELMTCESGGAGLNPVINYLANNTDKFYVDGNKAILDNV